jgi:hypothetical protein
MINRFPRVSPIPQIDYSPAGKSTASLQNEQFSSAFDFPKQFGAAVVSLTIDNTLFHKIERGCS